MASSQVATYEKIVLNTRNSVTLRGPIDANSVQKAQLQLVKAVSSRNRPTDAIYLVLDSPGGSIEDGLSLIEFAKTIPNLHTISIFAASMASATVQALPGDRLLTNNGILMFHRASGGFRGQFEDGEVEQRLELAKLIVRSMEAVNSQRMRMTLADYKSLVVNELWLYSQRAVAFRAADRIVDIACTTELINARETLKIQSFFFTSEFVFSQCPLFRLPLDNKKNLFQMPSMSNFLRWSPDYYRNLYEQRNKK